MRVDDKRLAKIETRERAAAHGPYKMCSANHGKCNCHLMWSIPNDCVVAVALSERHTYYTDGEGYTDDQACLNGDFLAATSKATFPVSEDERNTLLSMSRYWQEVRERDDQTPLAHECQQVYRMLGPSRVLLAVEIALRGIPVVVEG